MSDAKAPNAHEVGVQKRVVGQRASPDRLPLNASGDEFIQGLYEASRYSRSHPIVIALICFEAAAWASGTAILLFLLFHAAPPHPAGNGTIGLVARALECGGLGLLGGAFVMSKLHRKISPILTYVPALFLAAYGLHAALRSEVAGGWTNWSAFVFGLGGGLFAGRIGADLKAIVESEIHERIVALKRILCVAAVLLTMLVEALAAGNFEGIVRAIPTLLYISLPLVFALSWITDVSIHNISAMPEIREFPGPLHRLGYRALRAVARSICRRLFRYEPVDALNVPEAGGVVIAANHGSFIDPILLSCGTDRLIQYVIYSSYYRSLAHPFFRFLRCIPIDEHDQLGALRTGVRSLKLGACIGIFPEGEVSAEGKLHTPMRGALFLAQRSGAAVVSAALKGDYQALPRGTWIPHGVKVTPIFGRPFAVDKELPRKETEALTNQLMADLAQKLELEPPPKIAEEADDKLH